MENPIPKNVMFYTPENMQELYDRIESFTGKEKALAYQIAIMTMNACSLIVDKMIEENV
jgi:hypothetical protein